MFCISPTNVANDFYNDFIKKENIFSEWSDEWVQELFKILARLDQNRHCQKDKPKHVLLILDYCCNTKFHISKISRSYLQRVDIILLAL